MIDLITVNEVAKDLGCNPQSIRSQANDNPKMLGFPIAVIGHRYYIPKEGYERWKKGININVED